MGIRGHYGDNNGTARKVQSLYIGDERGVARKCKNGYFGDENGIARSFFDSYNYVSLGDSIAVGYNMSDWTASGGRACEYGEGGNTKPTKIIQGSYTDLIRNELVSRHGSDAVKATSFAKSGDTVADLMEKLSHYVVQKAIKQADLVTICIGANDVLGPVTADGADGVPYLNKYINAGDTSELDAHVSANLSILEDDSNPNSLRSLLNILNDINPNAKYVFTTVYNPYKYLHLDEGRDGFFEGIYSWIPEIHITALWGVIEIDYTGKEIGDLLVSALFNGADVDVLLDRVNGIADIAENYVNRLNGIIKQKIDGYENSNISWVDTKTLFESIPDRYFRNKGLSEHSYDEAVNVNYTRELDVTEANWGLLWSGSTAKDYISDLIWSNENNLSIDWNGIAQDFLDDVKNKMILKEADPHPDTYGHYAMYRAFADKIGLQNLTRYTISYNANGGTGSMTDQNVLGLDSTVFAVIERLAFSPNVGYRFTGWADCSAFYDELDNLLYYYRKISSDTTIYAQWSNLFKVTYMHTNHTNLYDDDETGHMESYELKINGEVKPKFGTFASGSSTSYDVAYGSTIEVTVNDYKENDWAYEDKDCRVYFNGTLAAVGQPAYYPFTLTSDVIIDFRWKIAGSLVTLNAQSWEDCYITT